METAEGGEYIWITGCICSSIWSVLSLVTPSKYNVNIEAERVCRVFEGINTGVETQRKYTYIGTTTDCRK